MAPKFNVQHVLILQEIPQIINAIVCQVILMMDRIQLVNFAYTHVLHV